MARLNRVKKFRGTSKTKDRCLTCDACGDKIRPGDSYLWWANKMGRMSLKRTRCTKPECAPKPWDYQTTSPHIAGLMMAEDAGQTAVAAIEVGEDQDAEALAAELQEAVTSIQADVEEVCNGYREAGEAIESGFGHPTAPSEELEQKAGEVEEHAYELESFDPGTPEDGEDLEAWLESAKDDANDAITAACEVPG